MLEWEAGESSTTRTGCTPMPTMNSTRWSSTTAVRPVRRPASRARKAPSRGAFGRLSAPRRAIRVAHYSCRNQPHGARSSQGNRGATCLGQGLPRDRKGRTMAFVALRSERWQLNPAPTAPGELKTAVAPSVLERRGLAEVMNARGGVSAGQRGRRSCGICWSAIENLGASSRPSTRTATPTARRRTIKSPQRSFVVSLSRPRQLAAGLQCAAPQRDSIILRRNS